MITAESLREKYASMETEDLLEIYANRKDYTELAIKILNEEFTRRRIATDTINNFKSLIPRGNNELVLRNYMVDLTLWEKMVFFVFWIPKLRKIFTYNFSNGYILKSQQADYYSIIGFVIFAFSIPFFVNNAILLFSCLITGFLGAYVFDVYYNLNRQIKILNDKVVRGEILGEL